MYISPPHNKPPDRPLQAQRDRFYRFNICRDVFPHKAVAARGARYEQAVFICERYGKPVDLFLYDEADVFLRKGFYDSSAELLYFFFRKYVIQALQRNGMRKFLKALRHGAAHALCRRIRSYELRMRRFQRYKFSV